MTTPACPNPEVVAALAMTREAMIKDLVEVMSECMRDGDTASDIIAHGHPGYHSYTNWQLREEWYRAFTAVPEEDQLYPEGEEPPSETNIRTVGELIQKLLEYSTVKDRQWRPMIEYRQNEDVSWACRITFIRADNVHHWIRIHGPDATEPPNPDDEVDQ